MHSASKAFQPPDLSFDRIELRVALQGPGESYPDDPQFCVKQSVFINGENLAPSYTIDWVDLAKSCQLSGEFFIVTCGCGQAACAGIYDGIRVTHLKDRIVWEIPEPISYNGLSDEEGDRMEQNRVYKHFSFEPGAYLHAVQEGLRLAKGLLFGEKQPVECSPCGMTPDGLLALDPLVFSQRGAPVGCQIVGRTVQIRDGLYWIAINGINYRLAELPIPDDIKALNDWSGWEPKACAGGFVFGPLAAPEHEVRRRMRKVARYLATIVHRGTEIQVTDRVRSCEDGSRIDRRIMLRGELPCSSGTGVSGES